MRFPKIGSPWTILASLRLQAMSDSEVLPA